MTVYFKHFDVPDTSSSCANQYVRIKSPSASLDLCNGVTASDSLVSIASSSSSYTLELTFNSKVGQNNGIGFLIFVSTKDTSSISSSGTYTDLGSSGCANSNRQWTNYVYSTSTVASSSTGTTACKTLCTADANCQLMVRKGTACYLGRFDITTALSGVSDSAPDAISLNSNHLLDTAASRLVAPLSSYTARTDLFSHIVGVYHRIKKLPIVGISEAECAARCLLQCDDQSSAVNPKCQYYLYEKKVCYFGKFGLSTEDIDVVDDNGIVLELPCSKFMIKNSPALDVKGLLTVTTGGTCTAGGSSNTAVLDASSSSFSKALALASTTSGTVECNYYVHRSLAGGRMRLSISARSVNSFNDLFLDTVSCETFVSGGHNQDLYWYPIQQRSTYLPIDNYWHRLHLE